MHSFIHRHSVFNSFSPYFQSSFSKTLFTTTLMPLSRLISIYIPELSIVLCLTRTMQLSRLATITLLIYSLLYCCHIMQQNNFIRLLSNDSKNHNPYPAFVMLINILSCNVIHNAHTFRYYLHNIHLYILFSHSVTVINHELLHRVSYSISQPQITNKLEIQIHPQTGAHVQKVINHMDFIFSKYICHIYNNQKSYEICRRE